MSLNIPVFFTRLGSAIVFAALMMAGLLTTHWAFLILVFLIQFLCLKEYFKILPLLIRTLNNKGLEIFLHIWSALMILFIYALKTEMIPPNLYYFLGISILLILASAIFAKKETLRQVMYSFSGLIYITLPMSLFLILHFLSWEWPLVIVLMIWSNDTFAYLVGSFLGKTPLSSLSPKKTWEGTLGGAILTILGAVIWAHFSTYNIVDAVSIAMAVTVFGTIGDLFESKLKRLAGIKDSGNLMPGHGGALDRFDSLLVALPFTFIYLYFIYH